MKSKYTKVMVIVNPAAGGDEPVLNSLNSVFQQYGLDWDVKITHQFGDATRLAKEAIAQEYDLVAGYGGDGTQMEIANGLMGSNIPMAILPGGTGNAMAFELKVPRDLRQAAHMICTSSNVRAVDLGKAGDNYFMLRLYSGVKEEQKTSREDKDRFGILAYPISTVQMVRHLNHALYTLTIDGEKIEEKGISIMILNAGSTGGLPLSFAGNIDVSDGLLDAFMIDTSISTTLSAAERFLHLPTKRAGLHFWRCQEIIIETDIPQTMWIDGELLGPTPTTVTAVPAAINIVVP